MRSNPLRVCIRGGTGEEETSSELDGEMTEGVGGGNSNADTRWVNPAA